MKQRVSRLAAWTETDQEDSYGYRNTNVLSRILRFLQRKGLPLLVPRWQSTVIVSDGCEGHAHLASSVDPRNAKGSATIKHYRAQL